MFYGVPIAALVGNREFMENCTNIFYSLTFAGETLSLAASNAVMEVIDEKNVPRVIEENGQYFLDEMNDQIRRHRLQDVVVVEGSEERIVCISPLTKKMNKLVTKSIQITRGD